MMLCGQERDKLAAYLDGEIQADQATALEQHLRTCTQCAAESRDHGEHAPGHETGADRVSRRAQISGKRSDRRWRQSGVVSGRSADGPWHLPRL